MKKRTPREILEQRIHLTFASEMCKIQSEIEKAMQEIAERRRLAMEIRRRDLAVLDVQFCGSWQELIIAGVRANYRHAPSHMARCAFGGRVRSPSNSSTKPLSNPGFADVHVEQAVRETFEVVKQLGSPVCLLHGIGIVPMDRASDPKHTVFSMEVLHDLPEDDFGEFSVVAYSILMEDEGPTIRFSVDAMWQSRTIPEPEFSLDECESAGVDEKVFAEN